MKYLICLLLIFGLTDLNAQSGKSKVQTKIASYEAEKTLDDIKWYDGEPEGIQMINIKVPQEVVNMYPELREKRVGVGMSNRIIEALEEAGRFYFVEEKDEIIAKMVKEWERSVSGMLEEEISRRKAKLKNTTMVGIQVRLVSVETGKYITGSGLGTSAKEGEGLLKNLDMSFDQSTVSFATTGAVITAVANVLRRMEKRGW